MSPKSKPKRRAPVRPQSSGPAKAASKRPAPPAPPSRRLPVVWLVVGGIAAIIVVVAVIAAGSDGGSGSGASSTASAELVANTKAADVPLLEAEAFETHTHTQLDVVVNGKPMTVPTNIGIDVESGHIAALHTHDASGLVHLESAKANDSYSLEQFLTVWGMPKDAAGRCAFFGAASPCTLSVTSKDSGDVDLDTPLKDQDTLTLTVTSD